MSEATEQEIRLRVFVNAWRTPYRAHRRKHNHRCRRCHKIMKADMAAIMVRHDRGTWCFHETCATKPYPNFPSPFEAWELDRWLDISEVNA